MMKAVSLSAMSVTFYQTTRRYNPEGGHLQNIKKKTCDRSKMRRWKKQERKDTKKGKRKYKIPPNKERAAVPACPWGDETALNNIPQIRISCELLLNLFIEAKLISK
jgi:hypothetical protein